MHNGRVKVIAMARKQVVLVMVEMVELVLIRIPILILMLSAVLVVLLLGLPHTKWQEGQVIPLDFYDCCLTGWNGNGKLLPSFHAISNPNSI